MIEKLESREPERQRLYKLNGREYSVVDLTYIPKGLFDADYQALMQKLYPVNMWELADVTGDVAIEVLGRFASVKQAREWIEENRS